MPRVRGKTAVSRELYEGFALQAVDEKGRVAIPADLRTSLDRNSDAKLVYLARHETDPCLSARDPEWSKEKHARIDRRQQAVLDAGGKIDPAEKRRLSMVEKAPYDGSGRFVIPPLSRGMAKIGKWAFFIGASEEFEIWAPEVLMTAEGVDDYIREACAFCLAQRGVTL